MSCSAYAKLVAGVRVHKTIAPKTVTRYHEVTGQPYSKTIKEDLWVIDDTKIALPQGSNEDDSLRPLENHFSDWARDEFILGVEVVPETTAIIPITLAAVQKATDTAAAAIVSRLFPFAPEDQEISSIKPKIYLVLRHSY